MPSSARAIETARAAKLSIVSNAALTVGKLVVGLLSGSISVISEAVHSASDLVAALLAFFSVRKANEPADERHGYGHGKFESLSGAVEASLIIVAALIIAYQAIRKLASGDFKDLEHGMGMAVMGFSALANVFVSTHLFRVAEKHDSLALRADAWNLRADVVTSAGVCVGLGVIAFTGWRQLDPIVALIVAGLILYQGQKLAGEALGQLVDRALPEEELAVVQRLIADHQGRHVGFHALRSRRAGRDRHLDLHLVVCADMSVNEAHAMCDRLETQIEKALPGTNAVIHVEPCDDKECAQLRAQGKRVVCLVEEREAAEKRDRDADETRGD